MAEGAAVLREALSDAVDARVRGRELVSCDLGGVDSTSVCCLAARLEASVVAYTAATRDPMADDVAWAGRTVAALGTVEHHVIPAEEMPLVFQGVGPWATGWTNRARHLGARTLAASSPGEPPPGARGCT